MISFNRFINETPLPDDWDKDVYTKATSFKRKIDYAIKRAQKIGSGSSRVAFEVQYQGRPTILKIAKNGKGLVQNEEEINILTDNCAPEILISIIDYDKENNEPVWLHVEKATKVTEKKLCKIMRVPDLRTLVKAAKLNVDRNEYIDEIKMYNDGDVDECDIALQYVDQLTELEQSFNVNLGDFMRAANWGLYNNEPVIIDVGFTEYTKELYSR